MGPLGEGVLKNALWAVPDERGQQSRKVVWQVAGKRRECIMTGAVIMIANSEIDQIPSLAALKTRIPVVRHLGTFDETAALIREIASHAMYIGRRFLSKDKCLEVAAEVIERSSRAGRPLDVRLFTSACSDRIQFEAGFAQTHWLGLLESRIRERAVAIEPEDEKPWVAGKTG